MKYLSIIIILIAAACSSPKNIIQLKINEEKTIELPGTASSGAQMVFTLSDTSVAKVSRKEIISTYDSTGLRPGDPVLAIWVIKGLKGGTTSIKFAGKGNQKNNGANVRLKNLKIVVTD